MNFGCRKFQFRCREFHSGTISPLPSPKLKASFGGQLFERGFGGSDSTGEGLIVQRRVRRMLDQMERAVMNLTGQAAANAAKICRRLTDARVRCHIAIADAGSAAEAALALGSSQPAVHQAARQIEQNVGVSLYRRRVHSVSANAAGVEFARCLSLALYEITQAVDELGTHAGISPARSRSAADHDWVMPQHNVPRRAVIDSIFAQLPEKPPLVLETSSSL
ncbi:LysR family transcriptional regulator [Paraburkholderia youngii]|uniref:LysR family transcriptional regulator n=1 Tax=Paraburkholderia youngii TaxID=2782701 RepID=UPI003D1A6F40